MIDVVEEGYDVADDKPLFHNLIGLKRARPRQDGHAGKER